MKCGFLPEDVNLNHLKKEPEGITVSFGYAESPSLYTTVPTYYNEDIFGLDWREAGYFFVMFAGNQRTDLTLLELNFVVKNKMG